MAILSVDTYLQKEIKSKLSALLQNTYIIREVILRDFDKKVRENFIKTFCNTETSVGKEIPVLFTFPQTKQSFEGFILIQFKGADEPEEKAGQLGMLTGYSNMSNGDIQKEKHEITIYTDESTGKDVAYFELNQPVYELYGIDTLSINSNKYHVDGNRVYIPIDLIQGDDNFTGTISYSAVSVDTQGNQVEPDKVRLIGYDLAEVYTVDSVSNNMDTLRCLDAILRTIFIMLRQGKDEQVEYRLQSLNFRGTDLQTTINNDQNSAFGEQLYFRRVEVGYTDTYTIPDSKGFEIKDSDIEIDYEKQEKDK